MEITSIIFGFLIVAAFIIPFVIMGLNKKKADGKLLQSLKNIAKQNNCLITKYEYCGEFVIGLDESKKFVFFYKKMKSKNLEQYVDLSKIQSCKVINISKTINKQNHAHVLEKLELSFIPISKKDSEVRFEFYDLEVSIQPSGEFLCIEKWSKMINDIIKMNSSIVRQPELVSH